MKFLSIVAIFASAFPLARATTSYLITNGTFETGTIAGWTATSTAYDDTTGSCNDGFAAQSAATGCATGINPVSGTYAAYSSTSFPSIGDNVGEWDNFLSQSFVVPSTTINVAQLTLEYTATWGVTGTFLHGVNVGVEIVNSANSQVYGEDFVINPESAGSVPWTAFSADLTSLLQTYQGQSLTLELFSVSFYDTRGGQPGNANTLSTGFDNVQIAVNAPEPGVAWMAGSGLVLILGSRLIRRRR